MKRVRQNANIDQIIDEANAMLANPEITQSQKTAICCLLDSILMSNKRYSGFQNIYWLEFGAHEWYEAGAKIPDIKKFLGPEYDRRYYK